MAHSGWWAGIWIGERRYGVCDREGDARVVGLYCGIGDGVGGIGGIVFWRVSASRDLGSDKLCPCRLITLQFCEY